MEGTSQRAERYIQVDNETESLATRVTKEGKQYTYRMKVLQQPMRARACGAGAKSSADRRPVDPPPIVELKIFEGDSDKGADVTFNMSANYFLFATLEQARHIAHGRVGEEKQRLTVLTGTPVAGMVYLDRPSPAGYFIFPDLSVRHEGKYRLSFSLYEELKDVKDDDKSDPLSQTPTPPPDSVVTHRLEVKSQVFTVFSAKKFPGLTESTSLSRMVAEQGCRVRIRRDVRMRRRDTKSGKEWDDYEDETAAARARVSSTPDPASAYPTLPPPNGYESIARPRSASNASQHSSILPPPVSRRVSLQEMNHAFQHPFTTGPHTPQNSSYAPTSPYGPPPSQQYPPPSFMQQPSMQPPPPQYSAQHSYQPPQPISAPVQSPQSYYGYTAGPTSQTGSTQYSTSAAYNGGAQPQRMSGDLSHMQSDDRRSSASYGSHPATQSHFAHAPSTSFSVSAPQSNGYNSIPPLPPQQPMYSAQHQSSYSSQDPFTSRGPPQPVQPPTRTTGVNTPLSSRSSFDHRLPSSLPPLHVPNDLSGKLEPSPIQPTPADSYYSAASTANESRKRHHGEVFREPYQHAPLRQGARPAEQFSVGPMYPGSVAYEADDGDDATDGEFVPASRRMQYHRADGRTITRSLPPHSDETLPCAGSA